MKIKSMNFAGAWYPGDGESCRAQIQTFLDGMDELDAAPHMAGIVPHAGWVYSGSIACRVLAHLAVGPGKDADTVILFGGHLGPDSPSFFLGQGGVETPLGNIEVDEELGRALKARLAASGDDIHSLSPGRFPDDNTLELQYPFIKFLFPNAKILPVGIAPPLARGAGEAVVDIAKDLGREIRVVGSTDMSHYGPQFGMTSAGSGRTALDWVVNTNDAAGLDAMGSMDEEQIISQGLALRNLCCPGAAGAAASAAKKMGAAKGTCLDYATSYSEDDPAHFVGYGGILYS